MALSALPLRVSALLMRIIAEPFTNYIKLQSQYKPGH